MYPKLLDLFTSLEIAYVVVFQVFYNEIFLFFFQYPTMPFSQYVPKTSEQVSKDGVISSGFQEITIFSK